jgi:D-3-phosphoglycerate dehydrogenase
VSAEFTTRRVGRRRKRTDVDGFTARTARLAGAAIDVFDPEPPPADYPLLGLDNVLLTPHMAARTHTAVENMSWVVRDVVDVLGGQSPRYPAP